MTCCLRRREEGKAGDSCREMAGGVTSGIDFGLRVVADLAGYTVAQGIQLSPEYDPDPPFASGHPDRASESVMASLSPRYERARADFRAEITRSLTILAP